MFRDIDGGAGGSDQPAPVKLIVRLGAMPANRAIRQNDTEFGVKIFVVGAALWPPLR